MLVEASYVCSVIYPHNILVRDCVLRVEGFKPEISSESETLNSKPETPSPEV